MDCDSIPQSLRWILRWMQIALFGVAISTLAYCGFVVEDAWVFNCSCALKIASYSAVMPAAGALEMAPPSSSGRSVKGIVAGSPRVAFFIEVDDECLVFRIGGLGESPGRRGYLRKFSAACCYCDR